MIWIIDYSHMGTYKVQWIAILSRSKRVRGISLGAWGFSLCVVLTSFPSHRHILGWLAYHLHSNKIGMNVSMNCFLFPCSSTVKLRFTPEGSWDCSKGQNRGVWVPTERQRGPHSADIALILIGAIMSAIDQYFKVRAGPSGVVCGELKESLPWPLYNLHKSG